MLNLKQFRNTNSGLADFVNYAAVIDDGIVMTKDGSLMAGWYYTGYDVSSDTAFEKAQKVARLNRVLVKKGSGWMMNVDVCRIPANEYPETHESHFPDPISRLIDNERRHQFHGEGAHYENLYAIVLTFQPALRQATQISELMYENKGLDGSKVKKEARKGRCINWFKRKTAKSSAEDEWEQAPSPQLYFKILNDFKLQMKEFEASLLNVFINVYRMGVTEYTDDWGVTHKLDSFLQYLNFCLNGDRNPIELPPCPMYLDSILGFRDFYTTTPPQIGDKFIGIIAIDGFPHASIPGILNGLDSLPISMRWSTRFIFMDSTESIPMLNKYKRKWEQKRRGFFSQVFNTRNGQVNQDAVDMAEEADAAMSVASRNVVAYGYYTTNIVLLSRNMETLTDACELVRKAIERLNFSARIETTNAVDAWMGTLPGHKHPNVRRPILSTMNVVDMLPMSSVWSGARYAPCPLYPAKSPPLIYGATEGNTPFRLNLHVSDVGHTLVFGPTGAGKSTALAMLLASFLKYANGTVFCFDKDYSMFPMTMACRGNHYELGGSKVDYDDDYVSPSVSLNPLQNLSTEAKVIKAEGWLCSLLNLQKIDVGVDERTVIHRATQNMLHSGAERRLTSLIQFVEDPKVASALGIYAIGGPYGDIVDATRGTINFSNVSTFEMGSLLNAGDEIALPVLLHIFDLIEDALTGQPSMIILDEAWMALRNKVFANKIREWFKLLRKANCCVVLATQSLSDAYHSGLMDVLIESCPTKILLPNENANQAGSGEVHGPKDFYVPFGLNERQINILANEAQKKKDYYILSTAGRRMISLNLGPVALAFAGATSKQDLSRVRSLIQKYGPDDWPYKWLDEKNVDYQSYLEA